MLEGNLSDTDLTTLQGCFSSGVSNGSCPIVRMGKSVELNRVVPKQLWENRGSILRLED